MNITIIILLIIFILLMIPVIIISVNIEKELNRKNNIEELKNKNELYRIYMDIDIVKTEEIIDNILKKYIDKWVLTNITAEGDNYIKDQEVQELIRYVTANFIADMSDVHLFYIRCLTIVVDDKSIVRYVRNKVKYLVLDFITDYNSL